MTVVKYNRKKNVGMKKKKESRTIEKNDSKKNTIIKKEIINKN